MKKLLCLSILTLGIFVSVQAQALFYQLNNISTTETWEVGLQDANGNTLNSAIIAPTNSFSGTFIPFALPLQWRARNSSGCYSYGTITAPGGPVSPPYLCSAPSSITYQLIPFGFNYFLQFQLN